MNTHTPGPWTHRSNTCGALGCEIRGAADEMIADVYDAGDGRCRVANAHLLAAAPDLLEAAKHAAMEWRLHGQLTDSCRVLEAAIAKAEGAK